MATYPIKMLKDEEGNPFVPLTQVDAVVGNKYITASMDAIKVLDGHYQIENDNLSLEKIQGQIVSVNFPLAEETSNVSYLKLNNEGEYPIYNEDGSEAIKITSLSNTTTFLLFDGSKYKIVKTAGSREATGGGHVIVNNEGNILPQRPTLTFKGLSVNDDTTTGSTVVNGPVLVNNLTTTENNVGALDAYQGKALDDKKQDKLVAGDYINISDTNVISATNLDDVPLNTVVDYDGSVIPDGWEQIPDQILWDSVPINSVMEYNGETVPDGYEQVSPIFESELKGGESVTLSNHKRFLDIYAHVSTQQVIKYTIDTNYNYTSSNEIFGSGMAICYDGNELQYYISETKFNKSTNLLTHTRTGFTTINTGVYQSRNNNNSYAIYRIDTHN